MRSCARATWLLAALAGLMLAGARPAAAQGRPTVALTARIIDTATGEIMVSAKGDGTSKRSGLPPAPPLVLPALLALM
jgi:hypothetical protein